jgi:hypothetical protein
MIPFPDHLPPSIMVKGLKDIHPWPLLGVSLSIQKNKVKKNLKIVEFYILIFERYFLRP